MHQTFRKTEGTPWSNLPKETALEMKEDIMRDFTACLEHGFTDQRTEFRDGMDIDASTGPYHPVKIDKIYVDQFTYDAGPWLAHVLKMVVEFTPIEP